jgi:hypothetical protein
MHKKAFILCSISVFIILFAACKHELPPAAGTSPITVPGGGTTGGGGTGSNLVCFESDILPIFQTNCAKANCHDAASHQEGYVFNSYANIIRKGIEPGDANDSKVYEVLFETGNDKMPQAPNPDLTAAQKTLIGKWINEGARNTTNCGSSTGCDVNLFKYNADIKPIFASNCTGCHGGTNPDGGINLTVYEVVKTVGLNGRLVGAITHTPGYQPMPRNANKLSDCRINQIKNWVSAGALNN